MSGSEKMYMKTKLIRRKCAESRFFQVNDNKSLVTRIREEQEGSHENEGISVDVIENTCRKNVAFGLRDDVYENKWLTVFERMFMKNKPLSW